jgi:molybdopterin converting factor small subunit
LTFVPVHPDKWSNKTVSVKILISEAFQSSTGGSDMLEVKGSTMGECLKEATGKYPALGKMWFDQQGNVVHYMILFLNGENVPKNDLNQVIKDGDEIYPVLMIGGG